MFSFQIFEFYIFLIYVIFGLVNSHCQRGMYIFVKQVEMNGNLIFIKYNFFHLYYGNSIQNMTKSSLNNLLKAIHYSSYMNNTH